MKPTIADVQAHVSAHFNMPLHMMTDPCRRRSVARPRQIAMYLSRKLTRQTYPQIGRRFERDHSTVVYAVDQVERLQRRDAAIRADVAALRKELER